MISLFILYALRSDQIRFQIWTCRSKENQARFWLLLTWHHCSRITDCFSSLVPKMFSYKWHSTSEKWATTWWATEPGTSYPRVCPWRTVDAASDHTRCHSILDPDPEDWIVRATRVSSNPRCPRLDQSLDQYGKRMSGTTRWPRFRRWPTRVHWWGEGAYCLHVSHAGVESVQVSVRSRSVDIQIHRIRYIRACVHHR